MNTLELVSENALRVEDDLITSSINYFVTAVEEDDELSILGTSFNDKNKEIFVIGRNAVEIATVEIEAIVDNVHTEETAKEYVKALKLDRLDTILVGITRIVGYYSRTKNWHRSKLAELCDRRKATKYNAMF